MSKIITDNFSLEIYGASHAESIGLVMEGIKKGIKIDFGELNKLMSRRKSVNAVYSTTRGEADELIFLSGIDSGGITNGEPIKIEIKNSTQRSQDYNAFKNTPRPSHADYVAREKYGEAFDMSGGGCFSGRMTAPLTAAGGIAKQILKSKGITVGAYVSSVGGINAKSYLDAEINEQSLDYAANSELHLLSDYNRDEINAALLAARKGGDSLGGTVEAVALNVPVGIGAELFGGLEGEIARFLLAIPAVKGVEFGLGFKLSELRGSQANDCFYYGENKRVKTYTNNSGGINGGISNGMPITLRVGFRPTPSISIPQKTVDLVLKENTELVIKGRHDACLTIRAAVVVEAAVALGILGII